MMVFLLTVVCFILFSGISVNAFDNIWEPKLSYYDSLYQENKVDSAISLTGELIQQIEIEYGAFTPQLLYPLIQLQQFYHPRDDGDEVLRIGKKGLYIIERSSEEYPYLEIDFLMKNSEVYTYQGNYQKARENYVLALSKARNLDSFSRLKLGKLLGNLGINYKVSSKFTEAENCFVQVELLIDSSDTFDDSFLLYFYYNYARVKQQLAKYGEAESLYKKALSIAQPLVAEGDYIAISILDALALVYSQQGRVDDAEELILQTIDEYELLLGFESYHLTKAYNRLAVIYQNKKKYAHAEKLMLKYLSVTEKTYSDSTVPYSFGLFFLSRLYTDMEKYVEADTLLRKCLRIRESLMAADAIQVGHTYFRLGVNCFNLGNYSEAEMFLLKALRNREKKLGPYHPNIFQAHQQLSKLYACQNDVENSLRQYQSSIDAKSMYLEYAFTTASESQKLRWLEKYPPIDNSLISFALSTEHNELVNESYNMVLSGKQQVVDALMAEKLTVACSPDKSLQSLFTTRNDVRSAIANLILSPKYGSIITQNRDTLRSLTTFLDSVEIEISHSCREFETELYEKQIILDTILKHINPQDVIIDYIRYIPYDFIHNKYSDSAPHYAAYIIKHSSNPIIIDLGSADYIDSLVMQSRSYLIESQHDYYFSDITTIESKLRDINVEIYHHLLEPILIPSDRTKQIYLSLDAVLHLLPFNALVDKNGDYVLENYSINYLSSARDIVKHQTDPVNLNGNAIIIADPDYDLVSKNNVNSTTVSRSMVYSCLDSEFPRLRYSRHEAESVSNILQKNSNAKIQAYFGETATEETLKEISVPPSVLHVITHGFYCEPGGDNIEKSNPLLNSCLILAGANRTITGETNETTFKEDGILTAYEVSGLNLNGTELVALSACESGLGEIRYQDGAKNEGVFGLKRALKHAGAKSVLMSLWKVSDRQTTGFMKLFYENWTSGQSKSKAVRSAMRELLQNSRQKYKSTHPLFWAGFILTSHSY